MEMKEIIKGMPDAAEAIEQNFGVIRSDFATKEDLELKDDKTNVVEPNLSALIVGTKTKSVTGHMLIEETDNLHRLTMNIKTETPDRYKKNETNDVLNLPAGIKVLYFYGSAIFVQGSRVGILRCDEKFEKFNIYPIDYDPLAAALNETLFVSVDDSFWSNSNILHEFYTHEWKDFKKIEKDKDTGLDITKHYPVTKEATINFYNERNKTRNLSLSLDEFLKSIGF